MIAKSQSMEWHWYYQHVHRIVRLFEIEHLSMDLLCFILTIQLRLCKSAVCGKFAIPGLQAKVSIPLLLTV